MIGARVEVDFVVLHCILFPFLLRSPRIVVESREVYLDDRETVYVQGILGNR